MNDQGSGKNVDGVNRLRLRTPAAATPAKNAAPVGSGNGDAAPTENRSKPVHGKAGLLVVLSIILLFVAGGYGLYRVLTYTPASTEPKQASGNEAINRSSRVRADADAASRVHAEVSAGVIVGKSEDPVLTVFEAPIEVPVVAAAVADGSENAGSPSTSTETGEEGRAREQSEAIGQFLSERFIGSVRLGETDPRVILDGRSYSRGDRIEGPYEIHFIAAREGVLYFEDDMGITYRRRF